MLTTLNRKTAALIAAALIAGPTSLAAQEKIGEVIATIDGESFEWSAYAPEPSGTDYNTSLRLFGPMQSVSVMGFPPGRVAVTDAIQITFSLMPGSPGTFEQEVLYAPEGMRNLWTSLDGEDLITIESFDETDGGAEVSGSFAGRICRKENMMSEPDPENCKDIEGRFSSVLPKLDV